MRIADLFRAARNVLSRTGIAAIPCLIGLAAPALATERGYDSGMLERGKTLFRTHCAECHGHNAEGTVRDWHLRDENGNLPPPPLNGTAHTWHHTVQALVRTVREGTITIGGSMPPWKQQLSDDEIFAIIIWLTSLWPDEIYATWLAQHDTPQAN